MKKSLLIYIATLLFALSSYGQDAQKGAPVIEKDETEEEDEPSGTTKIMIIPFNPSYYKLDVDKEAKAYKSEKKEQEIKAWFSFGLDENISPRILNINHEKKTLLNDYSADSDNDLKAIYGSIDYQYEKRDKKYAKKNQMLIDNLMGKIKQTRNSMNVEQNYESDKKHKEYVNAVITDPTLLPHLSEKYGVHLFVFINQFEIFTDYKKCIDVENKIYQRQIKLHFSIYDGTGEQLYGDLAIVVFYPNLTKDIDQIIMERFPVVANYLSAAFPDANGDE
jgi:hypothetical protein